MNDLHRMSPDHARTFDPHVVESIARDTAAPIDLVSRIYREELDALAGEARLHSSCKSSPVVERA